MGREYFYCFRCQLRLEGEDLDFGRAVRIREKVVCEKCIGDVIAPMTFKEQEEILLALKSARERRQDAARAERPKRETSTRVRIPAAIRPPGPPPPIKLPPSTNSNAGAVIFLMGALCLLVALGALYYVFGSNEYQAPPPLPPPAPPPFDSSVKVYKTETTPAPAPATPFPSAPSPKEDAAKAALDKAREAVKANAPLQQQIDLYSKAVRESEGTSVAPTAKQEHEEAQGRMKETIRKDLASLELEVRAACQIEEFGKAIQLLSAAKLRHPWPQWMVEVDGRIRDLNSRDAWNAFVPVREQAVDAKRKNDAALVKTIVDRVARWGIPSLVAELNRALGVESSPAATPASTELKSASEEVRTYQRGWDEALDSAASRDYETALAALQRATAKVKEAELKNEAQADLEVLKSAASVFREAAQIITQWPRGEKITIEFTDENLQRVQVTEAVVRADRTGLELQRGNETVFVELSEITPRSLVEFFRNRPEKKPETDGRAAALFCLLEGEAEGAKAVLGAPPESIPSKYWSRASRVAESKNRAAVQASKKELEARRLYSVAERECQKAKTRGAAVEKYRTLLNEYADTATVASKRARIIAQRDGAKDYVFLAEDLAGGGTFKSSKNAKVGSCWISDADSSGPKAKENAIDFTFYAFPDLPYRCWVYVGGCCQETFTFFYQATELTYTDPKTKQSYTLDPGAGVSLPVNHSLLYLKAKHEMHGGPKEAKRWEWISIPLPRYASAGLKTVRLLTESKGFGVAWAAVSATRTFPPPEAEMKALLKPPTPAEAPAPVDSAIGPAAPAVEARDPALVGHWKLDDTGGTALDATGNDNTGVLVGDPSRGPGKIGNALILDGKDRYVKIPPSATLDKVQDGSYTIALWFRPNAKPANADVAAKDGSYAVLMKAGVEGLRYSSDQKFRMDHALGGNVITAAASGETYAPGSFYHVVGIVSRAEGRVSLYVNGKLDGQAALPANYTLREFAAETWKMGIAEPGRWSAEGALDDVRIYNRALAAHEIRALARAGK